MKTNFAQQTKFSEFVFFCVLFRCKLLSYSFIFSALCCVFDFLVPHICSTSQQVTKGAKISNAYKIGVLGFAFFLNKKSDKIVYKIK